MKDIILSKAELISASLAALLLRAVLGLVFILHGSQKVLGLFGGYGLEGTVGWMNSELGVPVVLAYAACFVEFIGGTLILCGFLTRIWAFGLGMMMLVAMLTAHSGFFAPNGIEYPLTLFLIAAISFLLGAGYYSLDAIWTESATTYTEAVGT